MKKLLFIALVFASVFGIAQIKDITDSSIKCETVGKFSPMGMLSAEMEKCSDDSYRFSYKDYKYTHLTNIKSFTFKNEDNSFEKLYDKIVSGLESAPKEETVLKLPNDILNLKFQKALGITTVTICHTDLAGNIGVSQSFTRKQIDKIFGKGKS